MYYVVTVNNRVDARYASRIEAEAAARRIRVAWGTLYVVRVERRRAREYCRSR